MDSGRHRDFRGRWTPLRLALGGGAILAALIAVAVAMNQVAGVRACAAVLSAAGGGGQIATHYVLQGGGGNCSYPGPPADNLYVALPPSEYDSAAPCGSYLEVNGPDGSVRVKVVDQCPECAAGHIDLSETAFARIAPLSAGLISVSYQTIANPPLPGPLSFVVKTGSSRYWLALVVMNTGNAVASVQVQSTSGGWLNLTRTNWDGWIAQSGAGPGPFTIKVTDTLGHQATVSGVALDPGAVVGTGTSMYGAGSTTAAPPTASAAPPTTAAATPAASPSRTPASSPAARHKRPSASATPTRLGSLSAQVASNPSVMPAIDPQQPTATPSC